MDIGADCATEFPSKGVKRNFLNASGGMDCGEKVCCEFDGPSTPVSMKFQVSDARNPLASVARITEHGTSFSLVRRTRTTASSTPDLRRKR